MLGVGPTLCFIFVPYICATIRLCVYDMCVFAQSTAAFYSDNYYYPITDWFHLTRVCSLNIAWPIVILCVLHVSAGHRVCVCVCQHVMDVTSLSPQRWAGSWCTLAIPVSPGVFQTHAHTHTQRLLKEHGTIACLSKANTACRLWCVCVRAQGHGVHCVG